MLTFFKDCKSQKKTYSFFEEQLWLYVANLFSLLNFLYGSIFLVVLSSFWLHICQVIFTDLNFIVKHLLNLWKQNKIWMISVQTFTSIVTKEQCILFKLKVCLSFSSSFGLFRATNLVSGVTFTPDRKSYTLLVGWK